MEYQQLMGSRHYIEGLSKGQIYNQIRNLEALSKESTLIGSIFKIYRYILLSPGMFTKQQMELLESESVHQYQTYIPTNIEHIPTLSHFLVYVF